MHTQRSLQPSAQLAACSSTLFAVVLALGLAGCPADYPSCETDKDCHEKEFCVARKCQQCRDSADCQTGQSCNSGKCEAIAGYCKSHGDCPPNQACIANKCQACKSDKECGAGGHCVKGACSAKKPCKSEDECAQDEDCINGFCSKEKAPAAPPAECRLDPVYFDFNESALTTEATATLAKDAECLKKVGRVVTLTGHTDPRGTAEYNIVLSEKRAGSVKDHLGRLGADGTKMLILPRGALDAKGTDEPSWSQDRRVDFTWR